MNKTNHLKTGEYKKCGGCKKDFYVQKNVLNRGYGKFCSRECLKIDPEEKKRRQAERELKKYWANSEEINRKKRKWRKDNPETVKKWRENMMQKRWNGNWIKALERDIVCQICGEKRGIGGRRLDVHHLDRNEKNHVLTNLIVLCHQCHHFISRKHHNKSKINWETLKKIYEHKRSIIRK